MVREFESGYGSRAVRVNGGPDMAGPNGGRPVPFRGLAAGRARRRLIFMRCRVSLSREGAAVVARCPEFPECEGRGPSRDEALERLRRSVTFWLEACPCDQTAAPGLSFDIERDAS